MLFRLVRPMKRMGSRNRYFVRRIPADVSRKVAGLTLAIPVGEQTQTIAITSRTQAVRVSLRTDDPAEVKARQVAIDAYLENVWHALRADKPVMLTQRQATALAGELYRAWVGGEGRERTDAIEHDPEFGFPDDHIMIRKGGKLQPSAWRRVKAGLDPVEWAAAEVHLEKINGSGEPADLEKPLGPVVDRLLLARGIARVDQPTRDMLLSAFLSALKDAFASRKRNANGDYSDDPAAKRFPDWAPATTRGRGVSLKGLVEAWWKEAQATGRKPSTYESYQRSVSALAGFLGHDDAGRVTRNNLVAFKNHRLASVNPRNGHRLSPRTVKDSDLAGLKSVFGWAVSNGKLASNPAEGVTLKLGKRRRVRRGFEPAEAVSVLSAALLHRHGGERPETFAAKRWVPWLLAYSGARVGEMAQLRKEDIRREGKWWIATITPEAGTVKSDEVRRVVIHPHLVELGFIEFVRSAKPGHLFLRISRDGDVLGPLQGVKNRLAEFVRAVVPDKAVDPNHGWRHRFKTVCRAIGVDGEVRDHIQGHAPRNVAERYGEVPLKAVAAAINKLPRYKVRG